MCRSAADGGRRCPGGKKQSPAPSPGPPGTTEGQAVRLEDLRADDWTDEERAYIRGDIPPSPGGRDPDEGRRGATTSRVINSPTGPVNSGTGNQYNAPGVSGHPLNVGTGAQFSGGRARSAAAEALRNAARAQRGASSQRAAGTGEQGYPQGGRVATTIIGGTGPVNVGPGNQFVRQRPDGSWEEYVPGAGDR